MTSLRKDISIWGRRGEDMVAISMFSHTNSRSTAQELVETAVDIRVKNL